MKILISKNLKDIAGRVVSIGEKRMEKFHEHDKSPISKDMLDKIHEKLLGEYEGIKFYYVNGKFIRDHIDIDFVLGGNPGRYRYVPMEEIWVDHTPEKGDQAPTMVHEYVEMHKMIDDGWDYEKAHEYASKKEREIRLENKSPAADPFKDFLKYVKAVQS